MGYCSNGAVTKGLGNWALGAGGRGTALGAQAEVRRGARHGAQGRGARRAGAWSAGARGMARRGTERRRAGRWGEWARQQARGTHDTQARARPGLGLGMLLGQQAVHLVHSACFDPISTQYCS